MPKLTPSVPRCPQPPCFCSLFVGRPIPTAKPLPFLRKLVPCAVLSEFDFELPETSIARHPTAQRDASRLFHLDADGVHHHRGFRDVLEMLQSGDVLVVNDSRVLAARLGTKKRATGGRVEVLLVEPESQPNRWLAMLGASKTPKEGTELVLEGGELLQVRENRGEGFFSIELPAPAAELAARYGQLPLPPYIGRAAEAEDGERYQTVYAGEEAGSVAAPTAGLHFTQALLEALEARGVERRAVTLHVGPGTFLPVRAERIEDHTMHRERYLVPPATAEAVARAKAEGRRVVAVGTTSVRVLESFGGRAGSGSTQLFIRPGFPFRYVDAMITNFHLPKSTLLMLVSAFAGRDRMLAAYEAAVREGYRFYSYGDAMFLERPR